MNERSYVVRTFGCQMNESDSERLAGLFEAEGMVATTDESAADVLVLNTCCIRENADNKLYAALGNLKARKAAEPDLRIVVAGCLAQKDRDLIREKAPHVDVVLGTHNVHRAPALLAQADAHGPVTEIWEETVLDDAEAFPSALTAKREVSHSAWLTIQVGCDNSCAFCIVPSVRGREISRPFGELVAEAERLAADGVVEITLLGQNVNSYGRDLTMRLRADDPGPADAWLAGEAWMIEGAADPGPCSPTCSGPSARWPGSGGCGSPAPIPRTWVPTPSRRWPRCPRCVPTCTCRSRPAAIARCGPCSGATPPIGTGSASPPPEPGSRTWR